MKVVETSFCAQTNRNGHVYIGFVKVHKAPDAYIFHKIQKTIFWPMRIASKPFFIIRTLKLTLRAKYRTFNMVDGIERVKDVA